MGDPYKKTEGEEKEESAEGSPEKLPELELVQLQRSERPINTMGTTEKPIENLRPWNNYTIVTVVDSGEIKILDEDMRPVGDFKPPLSNKNITVRWEDIAHLLNVDYIRNKSGQDRQVSSRSAIASDLPSTLRPFAEHKLTTTNVDQEYFGLYGAGHDAYPTSSVEVTSDGKYVILHDKKGGYFAFLTQNEAGVALPPRQWTRIDVSYEGKIPDDLEKYAEALSGQAEGFKSLNGEYSALITDVGVNIVRHDNPKGSPVFSSTTPSIETNIVTDPSNPNIIYYCQSSNPSYLIKLDMTEDPSSWETVSAELPGDYDSIRNLQLDPSGNFFLFYSGKDMVVVTKDTLEEVKREPRMSHVNFDAIGRIRAVDKDGHLVMYEPNFEDLARELDRRRITKFTQNVQIKNIFDLQAPKKGGEGEKSLEYLEPTRVQYQEQFKEVLSQITTAEGLHQIRGGFIRLKSELRQQGLRPNEVTFILEGLEEPITLKEKEFAANDTQEAVAAVRSILAGSLSATSISEAREEIDRVRATEAFLDGDLRQEFRQVVQEFEQK